MQLEPKLAPLGNATTLIHCVTMFQINQSREEKAAGTASHSFLACLSPAQGLMLTVGTRGQQQRLPGSPSSGGAAAQNSCRDVSEGRPGDRGQQSLILTEAEGAGCVLGAEQPGTWAPGARRAVHRIPVTTTLGPSATPMELGQRGPTLCNRLPARHWQMRGCGLNTQPVMAAIAPSSLPTG